MQLPELLMAIGGAILLALAVFLAVKAGRLPSVQGSSYTRDWLGVLSTCSGLVGCVLICADCASAVGSSIIAWIIIVLVNLLAQPFLAVGIFLCITKIYHGMGGRPYICGQVLAETEFPSKKEYRSLARFCIGQGLIGALLFGFVSWACIKPLL